MTQEIISVYSPIWRWSPYCILTNWLFSLLAFWLMLLLERLLLFAVVVWWGSSTPPFGFLSFLPYSWLLFRWYSLQNLLLYLTAFKAVVCASLQWIYRVGEDECFLQSVVRWFLAHLTLMTNFTFAVCFWCVHIAVVYGIFRIFWCVLRDGFTEIMVWRRCRKSLMSLLFGAASRST